MAETARPKADGELLESVRVIKRELGIEPVAGIVLGSGLGPFADALDDARAISTEYVPHFPVSGVPGHAGRLVAGFVKGVPVLAQQGRVHGYEGYPLRQITHGVRVMGALGANGVIITNAAGSAHPGYGPGEFMLVRDHLDLAFRTLAVPEDLADCVPRARGGSADAADPLARGVYSRRLAEIAIAAARDLGIGLREGCLVYGRGPSYETAAEIRMIRRIGGHAACMSSVPEAVTAALLGLEVLAVSCITNLGTGLSSHALSHEEVTTMTARVADAFQRLLSEIVWRAYSAEAV